MSTSLAHRIDRAHKRDIVRYTTQARLANLPTLAELLADTTPEDTPIVGWFTCTPQDDAAIATAHDTYMDLLASLMLDEDMSECVYSTEIADEHESESYEFGTLTLDEVNESGGFIVTYNKFYC